MKLYFLRIDTNNPSADRELGIFDEKNVKLQQEKWEKIEEQDAKSDNPYYGKIKVLIDEFILNKEY
jgi:hypothetical protein